MATADLLLDDPETAEAEPEFFAPRGYEAIDGELLEKLMSRKSCWVGGELFLLIGIFLKSNPVGRVYPADTAFRCWPGRPRHIRKPDVAFLRRERDPPELTDGDFPIAPDLAVEVISPHDTAQELNLKLNDYRAVGIPLVWVIDPNARTVQVVRADRSGTILTDGDTLSGEDVLPGFACNVSDFLPPQAGRIVTAKEGRS